MKEYKVILLMDMDAFFASCHEAIDPKLKEKPLVVCSPNSRAIITTSNYKARSIGIKSGMPYFKAKKLSNNLNIATPDYQLYSNFSSKIFELLIDEYTPKVEVASIDECYIDATNIWHKYGSIKKLCLDIQRKIYKEFKLTCSIGASYTRFFAKMAVSFNKPNGVKIIKGDDYKKEIWQLDIEKMFMIGPSTAVKLREINIKTIGDLACSNVKDLEKVLGVRGRNLYNCANGISSDVVLAESSQNKSISNEFTLDVESNQFEELKNYIYFLCKRVHNRLERRFLMFKNVSVLLATRNRNGEFIRSKSIVNKSMQRTLNDYSDQFNTLLNQAYNIFEEFFDNQSIYKIGIGVKDLISKKNYTYQSTLDSINQVSKNHNQELESLKKNINLFYKKDVLYFGDNMPRESFKQTKYIFNEETHLSNKQIKKSKK
ncbi:DNA polymerase IV [Spiroplasma endosymbiont of Aspidapion aeneum]|uniref:Y-family DNA polymerase n=1 Tax=Spiroplasma endosymbiont of Aspidapion aeneum TaxID=3066276 RepID=UPI00313B3459